eukprot:Skav214044  [mRNA]  locus=scaffold2017:251199:256145:+ [translate_table: standard]
MGLIDLALEPRWHAVRPQQRVSTVAHLVIYDEYQQKHLFRTAIYKQFVVVTGELPRNAVFSFLEAEVTSVDKGIRIQVDSKFALAHQQMTHDHLYCAIDVCSGMGFGAQGLESADVTIEAVNELQPTLVKHQQQNGVTHIQCGDLGSSESIVQLHGMCPHPAILLGGFSCQPWSRLGDRQKSGDCRSSSLVYILRSAYFLCAHSIILECVPGAGRDPEVMKAIQEFETLTGFRHATQDLELSSILPARRDRWWCVLTNAAYPKVDLRPLPQVGPAPVIADLLPFCPHWSEQDNKELALDSYESHKFETYGGLNRNIANLRGQLATALHGWGNQLDKCPCGCRLYPMNESRFEHRGLHAALVLLEGSFNTHVGVLPKTRHLHPFELCVLHGVNPVRDWSPSLRLGIAGLGQMASPVQSNWIVGQLLCQVESRYGMPSKLPEVRLGNHLQKVFKGMSDLQPQLSEHPSVSAYIDRVWKTLQTSIYAHQPLACVVMSCPQESTNQPPVRTEEPVEAQEIDKQPPSRPAEPGKSENQPPNRAEGPDEETEKQPAEEAPGLLVGNHSHPRPVAHDHPHEPHDRECPSVAHDHPASPSHAPTTNVPSFADCLTRVCADAMNARIEITTVVPSTYAAASSDPVKPPGDQEVRQHEPEEDSTLATAALQPDPVHGGIPAFAVAGAPHADEHDVPITQAIHDHLEEADTMAHVDQETLPDATTTDDPLRGCLVIRAGDCQATDIHVAEDTTVGMLTVAEDKLGSLHQPIHTTDVIGCHVPATTAVHPDDVIHMNMHFDSHGRQISLQHEPSFAIQGRVPRLHLLHHQGPWVEAKEGQYYLDVFQATTGVEVVPVFVMPRWAMEEEMTQALFDWGNAIRDKLKVSTKVASMMLIESHWMPVVVQSHAMGTRVLVTPEGIDWARIALDVWGTQSQFVQVRLPHVNAHASPQSVEFACGFQSIGWLYANYLKQYDASEVHATESIAATQAVKWRMQFRAMLLATGMGNQIIDVSTCRFGGAPKGDITAVVSDLLIQHGVPTEAAHARATVVVEKIGRAAVVQATRAPHPWRELKTLANHLQPRMQLVLASEMNAAIQQRASNPKQVGSKQQKHPAKAIRNVVTISPEDVSIPHGIFREQNGEAVSQLHLNQVNHEAKGVIIMSSAQVQPYLAKGAPVSSRGLAAIVLDSAPGSMEGIGVETRFPARCEKTCEPVLLKGHMVQLGKIPIQRNQPDQVPKVEVIDNVVVRVLTFREELSMPWHEFISRPVRAVIQEFQELQPNGEGHSPIVDCWDKQFLSMRLERVKASEAQIYSVSFRLEGKEVASLLQQSGRNAMYVEPRSDTGKQPDERYRVIWLNRMDKPSALLAMQSTQREVSLVRSGQRYGLRVLGSHAAEVHQQHKPNTPFLNTNQVAMFQVGPFPYGATKQTILKTFQMWSWQARPVQPYGRSANSQGLMWLVHAMEKPAFEVYTLEHSDVIISELPKKTRSEPSASMDIQGSSRTMEALATPSASKPTSSHVDPFDNNDPWAPYQMQKQARAASSAPAVAPAELARIAAQIEQKVTQNLTKADGSEDELMADSSRVTELETRLSRLEVQVQTNHEASQMQARELAGQITNVQQQVESQSTLFTQHVDNKLAEQLSHIERILEKRARLGAGPHE